MNYFPRNKAQYFLVFLLFFLAGVFIGSFFDVGKFWIYGLLGATVFLIVFFWGSYWKLVFTGFFIMFLALGLFRINQARSEQSVLLKFADTKLSVTISGLVNAPPEKLGKVQNFNFNARRIILPSYAVDIDENILIRTEPYPEYKYGQYLKLKGELRAPFGKGTSILLKPEKTKGQILEEQDKDDFDYRSYLAKDGIYVIVYQPDIQVLDGGCGPNFGMRKLECLKLSVFKKIFNLRSRFEESVSKLIAEPNASYLNGILFGVRSSIPDDLKSYFQITGTTHVLAISGYNIAIIALLFSSACLYFVRRQKAFGITTLGIAIFTVMVGAGSSVVRAAIMGMLLLLAQKEGRAYRSFNAIVFTAAVMVYLNPLILRFDAGFQLSFAAVLGIIYLRPIIDHKIVKIPKTFQLRESIAVTAAAQLFALPIILYQFKSLSLVSIPVNALILPLMPAVMVFGFISGFLGFFSGLLGQLVGYLAWIASSYQLGIVSYFAKLPYASVVFRLPLWGVLLWYFCLIYLVWKLNRKS